MLSTVVLSAAYCGHLGKGCVSLPPHQKLVLSDWSFCQYKKCKKIFHYFKLYFPDDHWEGVTHSIMCHWGYDCSFNFLFVFSLLIWMSFLYTLYIQFSAEWVTNICYHSVAYPSILFMLPFVVQKLYFW